MAIANLLAIVMGGLVAGLIYLVAARCARELSRLRVCQARGARSRSATRGCCAPATRSVGPRDNDQ